MDSQIPLLRFTNCTFEVTPDALIRRAVDPEVINPIEHEFEPMVWRGCDVYEFVNRMIIGRKCHESERTDIEKMKLHSVYSTIGYLLNGQKKSKAVIVTDTPNEDPAGNEGRSGKTLLAKCIEQVVNVQTIDGRSFAFNRPFAFQKVTEHTDVINLDDARRQFDFKQFGKLVTGDFAIQKKNEDQVVIPFDTAPIFYVSLNTIADNSNRRLTRLRNEHQVILVSDYYNVDRSPEQDLGRRFFYDWDDQEWNRFYSFMIHCLQLYLQYDLVPFPKDPIPDATAPASH